MSDNNSVNSNASSNSRKHWNDHDSDELRRYCLSNVDETDCSFLLMDSEEVIESFQWVLCDISPKLKEILSKEENKVKGCKEIEIPDDYFKYILSYAYTKELEVDSTKNCLVTLYEVARKYEVDELAKMVIEVAKKKDEIGEVNWIYLFKKAKMDHPEDDGWQEYFEKVMETISLKNKNWYLEKRCQIILTFDEYTFDEFFDYIIEAELDAIHCFHAAEIYLKKRLFHKNAPKPHRGGMQKAILKSYIKKIKFDEMDFEELEDVFKSILIRNIYSD